MTVTVRFWVATRPFIGRHGKQLIAVPENCGNLHFFGHRNVPWWHCCAGKLHSAANVRAKQCIVGETGAHTVHERRTERGKNVLHQHTLHHWCVRVASYEQHLQSACAWGTLDVYHTLAVHSQGQCNMKFTV